MAFPFFGFADIHNSGINRLCLPKSSKKIELKLISSIFPLDLSRFNSTYATQCGIVKVEKETEGKQT